VILGSAPTVFKQVMDQKEAFHDFFEVRIPPELSNEQMLDLLSRRFAEDGRQSEFETRREELSKKIPAIEVVTGGNPRLVLFLYQIAQMSGPATPTEISEAARLHVPLVNAQLKRLKEGRYIRPIKLQRQESTRYDITDRLFRIWRQTATVAGRQRFRFLADFLKLYFTPDEIRTLYTHLEEYLRSVSGLPRDEIVRHVEELFYFQAAGENDIRYRAFSCRVESLLKIGELEWAEGEV
jgi:hypothetical protein